MKVRDGEYAAVDLLKLQLYCLDAQHPRGSHKARQFAARLGMSGADAELLRDQLLTAVRTSEDAFLDARDEFGQRYHLDSVVAGPAGTATVRSHWMTRTRDRAPRFLTCFVV